MPLDQETIDNQLSLLATHRRTLAHLLQQAAQFGGDVFAPPQTANGITEARQQIRRIKAALRKNGVQVEDDPNDKASRRRKPAQIPLPGDVVSGDKIAGDKVDGDKRTINTEGGDYAEGNIDKRQGAFVEGGTVIGDVIGQQVVQQAASLPPALHQLRAPTPDFIGREREIDQLVQALSKAATTGAVAAVSGVRGLGGIGKTELAHVVAHKLKDAYPDAQLLVELRGASSSPLTPEQALQTVILSFEREAKLPDDLSQLQALYRDKLAGKKALILADDAKDAAQVRPLLPPAGCALLVTSRNWFGVPGMTTLDLDTLPLEDAEKLLLEICSRIGEHASALAKLCGYLPLALRVSAELLRENVNRDIADYLKKLETQRLKHLSIPEDQTVGVEASLDLSYMALPRDAKSVLAQLSIFPTSFDTSAAATIVTGASDVEIMLEFLHRRSLLAWDAKAERWSLHDLVRAFASARLEKSSPVHMRYAQYYLKVATRAKESYLNSAVLAGLALFDQERAHIDAGWAWAHERAGSLIGGRLVINYASATLYIGDVRYVHHERILQLEAALAAARRQGNLGEVGTWLANLGTAYANLGDGRQAITYLEQALVIWRKLGSRRAEGQTLDNLGNARFALGDVRQAITFHEQALAIARELGDRRGEGTDLGNLGNAYLALGDVRQAIIFHEQALAIAREIGDRHAEGGTLVNLGLAYADLGDARKAISFYEQALVIAREIGDRGWEGNGLGNLGNAYLALGDVRQAIIFHEQALAVARELGDRRGERNGLSNLGNTYLALGDVRQAIIFHEQALAIAREIGDRRGEGTDLGNLGNAYLALGEVSQAITFHEQALAIARELGDRRGEGNALSGVGIAYTDLGDARQAITFYEQALVIAREIGDRSMERIDSWNLGLALEKEGNLVQAAAAMQVCVDFEREIGHADAEKHEVWLDQLHQRLAVSQSLPPAETTDEG